MGYIDSTTAVIKAVLTRKGREALARNDGSFQITKFALGDDEINYGLFDNTVPTEQGDDKIMSLPILEPSSNEETALRFRLITLPKGSVSIPTINLSPKVATIEFGTTLEIKITTAGGGDPQGYTCISRDPKVVAIEQSPVSPTVENGVSTATLRLTTGDSDTAQVVGSTKVDISGVNTGARAELMVTVEKTT
tara:strand:+ start:267 stop:845 length:579 start_codon:yes stop_codon:yes gene_type:complete